MSDAGTFTSFFNSSIEEAKAGLQQVLAVPSTHLHAPSLAAALVLQRWYQNFGQMVTANSAPESEETNCKRRGRPLTNQPSGNLCFNPQTPSDFTVVFRAWFNVESLETTLMEFRATLGRRMSHFS